MNNNSSSNHPMNDVHRLNHPMNWSNDVLIYTYDDILRLNNKENINVDMKLVSFFDELTKKVQTNTQANSSFKKPFIVNSKVNKYHKNADEIVYSNKHNIHFYPENRNVRVKVIRSHDDEVLKKIRLILSKITAQNFASQRDELITVFKNNDPINWEQISDYIYHTIIDNIFIIEIYIKLFEELETAYPQLMENIHRITKTLAKKPIIYEKSTIVEEATDKTKRCAVGNGLLIANFYKKGKYSLDYLNTAVANWIQSVTTEQLLGLEILVQFIKIINKELIHKESIEKLKQIKNTKEYPGRIRFLLAI